LNQNSSPEFITGVCMFIIVPPDSLREQD
jgi:hypothetical protein